MAVSTPAGLYQPIVMPFGVKNAPGSSRRVLSGRLNKGVFVFIDASSCTAAPRPAADRVGAVEAGATEYYAIPASVSSETRCTSSAMS